MSDKRAAAAAYLAEHGLEAVLSSALSAVARLGPNDLVLALAISLRRHAQTAKSHAEVESALNHAALAVNEAQARAVVAKVAQQHGPREAGNRPTVAELRSLEQTLADLINDVLYDMPTDPIRRIGSAVGPNPGRPSAAAPPAAQRCGQRGPTTGEVRACEQALIPAAATLAGSGLLRVSGAQHGTAEGVAPLVEAIHEALVAEAHGLLRGLASRLGEVPSAAPARPGPGSGLGLGLRLRLRLGLGFGFGLGLG